MNPRNTLILAAVALGLVCYMYFYELEAPGTDENRLKEKDLTALDRDEIQRLEITNDEGEFLFFKKEDQWAIEKPIEYPADGATVQNLLAEFSQTERFATIPRSEFEDYDKALEEMGLKNPQFSLKLMTENDQAELDLGLPTTRKGYIYVRLRQGTKEEIVVILDELKNLAKTGLDQWRSRRLFEFLNSEVKRVRIRREQSEVEVLKKGEQWEISKPLKTKADATRMLSYLNAVQGMAVESFVSDTEGDVLKYGLNTPNLLLEVETEKSSFAIKTGKPLENDEELVYALFADRPSILSVQKSLIERFANLLDDVRDRHVSDIGKGEEVQRVEIERGDLMMSLERDSKDPRVWRFVKPIEMEAQGQKLVNLLVTIGSAEIVEFLNSKSAKLDGYGLDKPGATIRMVMKPKGDEEAVTKEIKIGAKKDDLYFLESSDVPFVVTVEKAIAEKLPESLLDWYVLKLPFPESTDVTGLEIMEGKNRFVARLGEDGVWASEGVEKADLLVENLKSHLSLIQALKAVEWVGKVNKKDFTKPLLKASFEAGEGKKVLLVGKKMEEDYLAMFEGGEYTFRLSKEDFELVANTPYVVVKREQ